MEDSRGQNTLEQKDFHHSESAPMLVGLQVPKASKNLCLSFTYMIMQPSNGRAIDTVKYNTDPSTIGNYHI